jgi:hypothetical protein
MNPTEVMLCHHDLRLAVLSILISVLANGSTRPPLSTGSADRPGNNEEAGLNKLRQRLGEPARSAGQTQP